MRKLTVTLLLVLAVGALALAPEAKLTDYLNERLTFADDDELIPCYITLATQLDEATAAQLSFGATRDELRMAVMTWLQRTAAREQANLVDYLTTARASNEVGEFKTFWISNFVFAWLTPGAIDDIAQMDEIVRITRASEEIHDPSLDIVDEYGDAAPSIVMYENGREITWGVTKINADDVWGEGYTGAGVNADIADQGHRYSHYDLDSQYTDSLSYDYVDGDDDPYYTGDYHGTHCAGTVISNGDAGTQAGVSPGANYCGNRIYSGSTSIYDYEINMWDHWQDAVSWGIDLVSMSSGLHVSWGADKPTWGTNATNTWTAGVCLIAAAGNEGHQQSTYPPPNNIRLPGQCLDVITIGATNQSDGLAYFSSVGPVEWGGVEYTKPDVCAPGVDTKSTWNTADDSYSTISGTSMATPHVAGAVALLLEADPTLTPAQLKQILEDTAIELGDPGKDNSYGSGRIDALAAVQSLGGGPAPTFVLDAVTVTDDDNGNGVIEPGESVTIECDITNNGGAATDVAGTLTSSSGDITVTDGSGDFGDIAGGASASETFSFDVSSGADQPSTFDFTLAVQASGHGAQDLDFQLFSPVTEIDDDVESGEGYWTHDGTNDEWHIEDYRSHSPSNSWKCGGADDGTYSANMNASLYSPAVLIGNTHPWLSFFECHWLQSLTDFGYVEVNDGSGWTNVATYTGANSNWLFREIGLHAYINDVIQIRFRMETNGSVNLEGWYVDDIKVNLESSAAPWVAIETINGEDGLLLTWNADDAFTSFNVYRETDGGARIKLNERALDGGASGAWLDTPASGNYLYYVEGIDSSGEAYTYGPVEVEIVEPTMALTLSDPYPNPALGQVSFDLTTAEREQVSLVVYDLSGRRVATVHDGELSAGRHTLTWTAETASGVYIARLETAGQVLTRRVVIDR